MTSSVVPLMPNNHPWLLSAHGFAQYSRLDGSSPHITFSLQHLCLYSPPHPLRGPLPYDTQSIYIELRAQQALIFPKQYF